MRVRVVITIRIILRRCRAETSCPPQDSFVQRPKPSWPHQRLVIKTRRYERISKTKSRHHIKLESGPRVYAAHLKTIGGSRKRGQAVGQSASASPKLDKCVGFFGSGGNNPTRTMILKAPTYQRDPITNQCGCDSITLVSMNRLTVEQELKRCRTVNTTSTSKPIGLCHFAAPNVLTLWILLFEVSRSTMNHRRHPELWHHCSRCTPLRLCRINRYSAHASSLSSSGCAGRRTSASPP